MDNATSPGALIRETIRVGIPCECGCDEVAIESMSIADARQYATAILAACDDLPTGVFPMRGGDC